MHTRKQAIESSNQAGASMNSVSETKRATTKCIVQHYWMNDSTEG